MRPNLVVIGSVTPQNATQLRFVEHDEVIEAFAPNRAMPWLSASSGIIDRAGIGGV
jgi:hypothetical protein